MSKLWPTVPFAGPAGELVPHLSAKARTQMVDMVFEEIGGFQRFADWARREETEFYRIYARGAVRSSHVENTSPVTAESLMDEMDRRMSAARVIDAIVDDDGE